jgi:hypothetical protein
MRVMSPAELKEVFHRILRAVPAPVTASSQCVEAESSARARSVECPTLCEGRHPAGMVATDLSQLRGAAGYLARMAHFEAASVAAFRQLADELEFHGAPMPLVERARDAAKDEVAHAQSISALARKRGVVPPAPRVTKTMPRSLQEIALDNAREGCVREAFGALVGLYQSRYAKDEEVRQAMARVAEDEISHAALSFELAHKLEGQLPNAARAEVEKAREEALNALLHQAFSFEEMPWRDELGLPAPDTLFDLARVFRTELAAV